MSDHANLLLRNATAGGVVLAAKYHFGKNWMTALAFGAGAYLLMDWAINLRDQSE